MSFDTGLFEAESEARGLSLGRPLIWREETRSTNDDALAAAKSGAPHGALFGAETQSQGRGRRGSQWLSAPGEGLWFSLLLRPELPAEVAPGLALSAGLAVRQAIARRVPAPTAVQVKWPNDVLADGRKIAGVLVESQLSGTHVSSVIVGIGINVAQRTFPESLAEVATSLWRLANADAGRERLLADVLAALEAELARIASGGLRAVADALRPHDALLGRRLRIDTLEGSAAGIDAGGGLLVQRDDGSVACVVAGHVELLR